MNARGHLLILCVLLIDFQVVFCNKFGQRRSAQSDEQRPQTNPRFECGDRVLNVFLKQTDVVNLRVHGPLGNLLHLSQLAAFCGVSIKTTHADVHLLFSYDSCYVKQEETEYLLSLSWYGTDHILSCPVSVNPPSVVCKNNSMEIIIVGDGTTDELSVALNGEWAPLLYVATKCWHRERSKRGALTFSVPFSSCGVNFRDGRFILDLKSKGKMMPLSCPYEPIPVFPVKDPGLSETTQPLPKKHPNLYHKHPTEFPSQIVKQEQSFPVEEPERDVDRSPSPHPRDRWMPKLPSLPGSFNLAVNFPFSLPVPKQPVPLRDPFTSKPVAPTPEPTLETTPAPFSSTTQQLAPSVQNQQHHHKHREQELADQVTKAPKSKHYMQYPYRFQKPAPSPQSEPSLDLKYQFSRVPVPDTSLYQPSGSAQNYNFPSPNPLQGKPSLASLAQYLPPGYFICSYNQQQQPTQHFQPSQHFYQSNYGRHGSTTSHLSPTSPLIPINPHSQTSHYPSYPALQYPRPFHPEYYQKPSGSVQQPWSTSHLPLTGLSQESKPMVQASSHTPEYLKYQTGGDPSLDLYQRHVVHTSGRGILSNSQYQPSQLSTFPLSPLRPGVLLADVSTENTRSSPKGFFQPRSMAPSSQAPKLTGNNPIMPLPQPMPRFFPAKEGAQVAQLPSRQGPLIRGMRNPHVHSERPSKPRLQTP